MSGCIQSVEQFVHYCENDVKEFFYENSLAKAQDLIIKDVARNGIAQAVGTTLTCGLFGLEEETYNHLSLFGLEPGPIISRISAALNFLIGTSLDSSLKLIYQIAALVGNIFCAIGNAFRLEGKKFIACLSFAASNIVELVRESIRSTVTYFCDPLGIPVSALMSRITDLPVIGEPIEDLIAAKKSFENNAYIDLVE